MMPMQSHYGGLPHVRAGLFATLVVLGVVSAAAVGIALAVPKKAEPQPQLRIPERNGPRPVTFPTKIDR